MAAAVSGCLLHHDIAEWRSRVKLVDRPGRRVDLLHRLREEGAVGEDLRRLVLDDAAFNVKAYAREGCNRML